MYSINIEKLTLENNDYRRVLHTNKHQQLVAMSLKPGEDIPLETHTDVDQFIRIESGKGIATVNNISTDLTDGSIIMIPSGLPHYIKNTGDSDLKLYSVYSPAEHPINRIDHRQPDKQSGGRSKNYRRLYYKYKGKYLKSKHA